MPAKPLDEEALFHAARRIPAGAARDLFIQQDCGGDAGLAERIRALIEMHEQEPESAAAPPVRTRDYEPIAERLGSRIGPYRLMEQIGEGGFGLVFVAEQQEPVKRKIALKIIKPGMDSRQVIARFEAERQALALMDHPNIARVLDAGATDSGRPYFVMELVRGIPITEYCDKNQLAPRERLELFITVCQAIQHAHQKGIIHRDIKPSNVLVTSHDGKPVAKVIDFGVAKAVNQHLTERTIYTNFAQMIGTPLYMSPEQAEMTGLDIDTRSDIYSLGVLLYELLTGSTPLEKKRFREAAYDEIRRLIREEEPPKPSLRLSTSDTIASIAAQRKTEPARLSKLVRGDLDWITMKALEKDRTRRYETANGLARDIQRHLSDEPVEACPPSATYRLRKFAKKNRTPLATAAAIALLLVSGATISIWQALRAMDAERAARHAAVEAVAAQQAEAAQRRKAEAAAQAEKNAKVEAQAKEAEANAVIRFFEAHVFAAGRPKGQDGGLGSAVSLRDAILAGLPALNQAFAEQPLVEARLRMTLGTTFGYLGEAERAAKQYEQARALFTRHRGPDHPDTRWSMHGLAISYIALGRQAEAVKLYEETLAVQQRVLPKDHPNTLRIMRDLANSYALLSRQEEAIKLYEETLAAMKRVPPKDRLDMLTSMSDLAKTYLVLGRHAEAAKLYEETLAEQQRVRPKDNPDTLFSMYSLAYCYSALNRHAEALKLHEETLAGRKRVLPKDHPDTLWSMIGLAESLIALDRGAEALHVIDECEVKAAGRAIDPRLISSVIVLRLRYFQKAGDPAGCRATAAMYEKLNRTDAVSLYDAGCIRAVAAAVRKQTPGADATRLAREDADKAMAWLTKAVAAGYKHKAHMEKDADLDFLRDRDDFKKLLATLPEPAPMPPKKK